MESEDSSSSICLLGLAQFFAFLKKAVVLLESVK